MSDAYVTPFMWATELAIPVLIGAINVFIGIAAVWISKMASATSELALQLARDSTKSTESREDRLERQAIFDLIVNWAARRWSEPQRKLSEIESELTSTLNKAVLRLSLREYEDGSLELASILKSLEQKRGDLEPGVFAYVRGAMEVPIVDLLRAWLTNSTDKTILKSISEPGISELIEQARKDFEKDWL